VYKSKRGCKRKDEPVNSNKRKGKKSKKEELLKKPRRQRLSKIFPTNMGEIINPKRRLQLFTKTQSRLRQSLLVPPLPTKRAARRLILLTGMESKHNKLSK